MNFIRYKITKLIPILNCILTLRICHNTLYSIMITDILQVTYNYSCTSKTINCVYLNYLHNL